MNKQIAEALEVFRTEICSRSEEIDYEGSRDWFDLSYGFFLAKGLSPDQAFEAASEARYTHQYWVTE